MDRQYMDRHLVIDRYLQGNLTEDEEAQFEERLTWDQDLLLELEFAEKLRDGLRTPEIRASISEGGGRLASRLTELFAVPQYAAAASFVMAVALTAGAMFSLQLPTTALRPDGRPTEIVPLLAVRGADVQTVTINEDAWTVLLVDATLVYDTYRLTIEADPSNGGPIWVQEGLVPTYPDSLAVGMPGSLLEPGRYVLSLEGLRPGEGGERIYERIRTIPFEVAAPPGSD